MTQRGWLRVIRCSGSALRCQTYGFRRSSGTALSTGLFSSDKAKETIQAGLAETRGSMELKGSVALTASTRGTAGVASEIAFQVASAAGGESIALMLGKTIIKYTDDSQSKMFISANCLAVTELGNASLDRLLERNKVCELHMSTLQTTASGNTTLTNQLMTGETFSLDVIPPSGAVLFIERATAIFLDVTMSPDQNQDHGQPVP